MAIISNTFCFRSNSNLKTIYDFKSASQSDADLKSSLKTTILKRRSSKAACRDGHTKVGSDHFIFFGKSVLI